MKTLFGALVVGVTALSSAAFAADSIKPAIVFDMGGRHDKSFNEGIDNGAKKFTKETGIKYGAQEVTNEAQREQFLRTFAQKGYDPILAVGFAQADALTKVAKEFPKLHFAIIDAVVDLPNVQSIVFKEQEGSFLVGMLAAEKSKTGTVGFVGGMDIPLIRKFGCGYVQGVKYANPNAKVLQNMTGTDPSAWNNPVKGGELAKSQIEQGADVVYAAAGGTGIGVYQAAVDAGKLAIGVDSDQNYLHPGKMLTSMVKKVDVATEKTFQDAKDGTWKPGIRVLGLAEDGVAAAFDKDNAPLITPEMKKKVEAAKADIISGKIKVHDYMSDNACPVS
ncbi:MAG TPA: BMP family ABC transporter substrate-binding protein [Magnetospirillaceae bacterium]|jgi:basic membrane protein A